MQYRPTDHSGIAGNGGSSEVRDGELLTPGEVARLFGVDPKTVTRWAGAGKLTALRTLGGHRRYRSTEVFTLLERIDGGRAGRPRAEGVANWGV